ncbi:MAG: hypothetical protein LH624_08955, partial [Cryobacterium sp.]|nr:hypothetical protein [Cryobacterium sp.]
RDVHDRDGLTPVGPDGPLAVSYSKKQVRIDHLLVSPSIHVVDCGYGLTAGVDAGSDHAIVTAMIRIPD